MAFHEWSLNRSKCMCFPVQGNVSVMSWDCVTWHGVGTLCMVNINAVKYRKTLENNLWPVFTRHFHNIPYWFQDDNAPVHSARIIEEYKRNNNINCITWSTLEIKCEAALNFEFTWVFGISAWLTLVQFLLEALPVLEIKFALFSCVIKLSRSSPVFLTNKNVYICLSTYFQFLILVIKWNQLFQTVLTIPRWNNVYLVVNVRSWKFGMSRIL